MKPANKSVHSFLMRIFWAVLIFAGMFVGGMGHALTHGAKSHGFCSHHQEYSADTCGGFAGQSHDHSGTEHEHDCGGDSQDQKSSEHHHHHICCVVAPMIPDSDRSGGFVGVQGVRVGLTIDANLVPDEPVFELDTPPLI